MTKFAAAAAKYRVIEAPLPSVEIHPKLEPPATAPRQLVIDRDLRPPAFVIDRQDMSEETAEVRSRREQRAPAVGAGFGTIEEGV